jgi:phage gp36-like protein
MAYATIADMVLRFGEAELIRATTPDGAEAVAIVPAPVHVALREASAVIDGYLRKRYRVPLDLAPDEINRACCHLARYDLSLGGERSPSEQTTKNRDDMISWLGRISRGEVLLDLAEVAPGEESFATMQTRRDVFSDRGEERGGFGGFWGDLP